MHEQYGDDHVDRDDNRRDTRPETDDHQKRCEHFADVNEVTKWIRQPSFFDDVEYESGSALDLTDAMQQDQQSHREAQYQLRHVRHRTAPVISCGRSEARTKYLRRRF